MLVVPYKWKKHLQVNTCNEYKNIIIIFSLCELQQQHITMIALKLFCPARTRQRTSFYLKQLSQYSSFSTLRAAERGEVIVWLQETSSAPYGRQERVAVSVQKLEMNMDSSQQTPMALFSFNHLSSKCNMKVNPWRKWTG